MTQNLTAIIHTKDGDLETELDNVKTTLEQFKIEYKTSENGPISERFIPITQIDGKYIEGHRALYNHLKHKKE